MGRGSRRAPQGGPEHERHARLLRGPPGQRQRDAAAGAGDDGAIGARAHQRADLALVDEAVGDRRGRRPRRCSMAVASAEQRELDPGALVQSLESSRAVRGDVAGHEQHGLHRSTAA